MVLVLPPRKLTPASYYDHSNDQWFKRFSSSETGKSADVNLVPFPYLKRAGFVPRKAEDFGDGGAFPEIHIEQYPLEMGRDRLLKPGSKIIPVIIDTHGNIAYDAIVRQNENSNKILYSQHKDLEPKVMKYDCEEKCDDEELKKEIEKTTLETKAALEKIVNVRLSAAQPKNVPKQSSDSNFIKYKPSQQSAAFNSGARERIIRMIEMPVDLLEPPKFKHKHVPKASGSPPVPVMRSPPRSMTVRDQQDWKVPPCISNWKNPKGYTIPLDKRLAADGRGLQDVQINDNFAKLSEALYVSEQKAREAVTMRSKVQKEMMMKEKERKEHELRALAQKARFERTCVVPPAAVSIPSEKNAMDGSDMRIDHDHAREREKDLPKETREEREERIQREKIREERRREREKERRLEAKDAAMRKNSKITRDRNRDVSEKVALGMASAGAGRGEEIMYDQRLFNQEKGMDSGFATDDQYNVYDQDLFTARPMLSTLYRPKKDVDAEIPRCADGKLEFENVAEGDDLFQ
ncbi:hypothetical protein SO802_034373 [Lithocarpus litseifolius]|uniref:SKI-interacting protein SKIP SNW domain-containing protein n=1 Tax=Lithocarpus litseifolius TaxID=425828 RepID=A0AAW2BGZ8_9ROSI